MACKMCHMWKAGHNANEVTIDEAKRFITQVRDIIRGNRELIRAYLEKHTIPFDHINENPEQPLGASDGKPIADAYVDDRGIQFNGDWAATAEEVLNFIPWEFRTESNK